MLVLAHQPVHLVDQVVFLSTRARFFVSLTDSFVVLTFKTIKTLIINLNTAITKQLFGLETGPRFVIWPWVEPEGPRQTKETHRRRL